MTFIFAFEIIYLIIFAALFLSKNGVENEAKSFIT